MYIGGLDIGTSGCKIAVYDENGKFVKCEYTEYDVSRSGGLHEIDPTEIFDCVKKVIEHIRPCGNRRNEFWRNICYARC